MKSQQGRNHSDLADKSKIGGLSSSKPEKKYKFGILDLFVHTALCIQILQCSDCIAAKKVGFVQESLQIVGNGKVVAIMAALPVSVLASLFLVLLLLVVLIRPVQGAAMERAR